MSAHKGTRARDGWEAHPHLGQDGDGNMSISAAYGWLSQRGCDGDTVTAAGESVREVVCRGSEARQRYLRTLYPGPNYLEGEY